MRMAIQEAAAATATTSETNSSIGGKSWDFLYPPHFLGEALKQIQGSLQDTEAREGAQTGTIKEKQQQQQQHQMLTQQERQQSQLLLQAAPAPPPTPLRRNDEGQQSTEGEGPLQEPSIQQQQIQPQQQQLIQLQQVQRLQLQQCTPPAPSELQRSPAHRTGLCSNKDNTTEKCNLELNA
ncbi:hypothetical protein EPH_0024060 [Eimeria praecox]|uniref:Uncharacterized protein n=1 Tax=Eimeria praecox TaxID=51316 RepID=U6H914_9EIME|nr:hypothetical protein EPH_0024060 [Eimeria praecox]